MSTSAPTPPKSTSRYAIRGATWGFVLVGALSALSAVGNMVALHASGAGYLIGMVLGAVMMALAGAAIGALIGLAIGLVKHRRYHAQVVSHGDGHP